MRLPDEAKSRELAMWRGMRTVYLAAGLMSSIAVGVAKADTYEINAGGSNDFHTGGATVTVSGTFDADANGQITGSDITVSESLDVGGIPIFSPPYGYTPIEDWTGSMVVSGGGSSSLGNVGYDPLLWALSFSGLYLTVVIPDPSLSTSWIPFDTASLAPYPGYSSTSVPLTSCVYETGPLTGQDCSSLGAPSVEVDLYGSVTDIAVQATPIPGSLPLFACGLFALNLLRRRRPWASGALAVTFASTLAIGAAKADTYQTYDLSGSYTEITAYNFDYTGDCFGGEFSCGNFSYSGEVTYDLTTQTFGNFSIEDVAVVSDGAGYAAEYDWGGGYRAPFNYPPGSTITDAGFGGAFCGANPEYCVGIILDVNIIQTEVTPLPATLPLFAAGLGPLGLFGWRRKREAP
jgi:hypothetical protein